MGGVVTSNSSLTLAISALPSSVFHQLPCSAFLSRKNWSATWIKRKAPWQCFQKRLLQLLLIQSLELDKLHREQCQSVGFNPIFNSSHSSSSGPASAFGSILYRSGMNKKIGRNFEVFTPWDFIAAITQHELPARALLRVVFQQDARPAGQAGGRRSADRGRRRGGDRRFCPRAAPHPF